jgi:hypothetical protein
MNSWIHNIWISLFLVCQVMILGAQEDTLWVDDYPDEEVVETYHPVGMFWSFDLDVSFPVLLTRDATKRPVYGLHTQFLYQINKTLPVFLGLAISAGQYDHESDTFYEYVDFEENQFKETTYCDIVHFDLKARYFPSLNFGGLEPFIDLSFGFRNSFAYTTIVNQDYDENVSTKFHRGDWGMGYAIGIGALVNMQYFSEDVFGHFSFDFLGGENSFLYLIKNPVITSDIPIDRFDRKSIPFQYLNFNTGIIIYF